MIPQFVILCEVTVLPENIRSLVLAMQRNEISEYHLYRRLAEIEEDPANREVLLGIADAEKRHYDVLRRHSQIDVEPRLKFVSLYTLCARIFGMTFAMKLMENRENRGAVDYGLLRAHIPEAEQIAREEHEHEEMLIQRFNEERLKYVGSIVLGLNDALVELTGALAGLTLALNNSRLIAMTGVITGIAASLSMAGSEYLSTKAEQDGRNPGKASLYTGIAYVCTVILLVFPFLVLSTPVMSLAWTLVHVLLIILGFSFYTSVALDLPFRRRFMEMAGISLGVAALSFLVGFLVRRIFNIEI